MFTDSIISSFVSSSAKAVIRNWKVAIALGVIVGLAQMFRKHRANESDDKAVAGPLDRPEMEDALA